MLVDRVIEEVWGYALFAAFLLFMGGGWIVSTLIAPQTPPGNPTEAFFFIPAGGLLMGLGVFLAWRAELNYRKIRKSPS